MVRFCLRRLCVWLTTEPLGWQKVSYLSHCPHYLHQRRPQTNTTLTFPSDPLLTVRNSKMAPRAMNQMSAPARWWNHINIWWCMAGCRAFEHGHNHDTESSQHLVISRGKAAGFMTPSKVNGRAKHQKQTTQLNESETFLYHCFSHSLPIKCFLNFMIYEIIAIDINIICNLVLEFGLDFISEIMHLKLVLRFHRIPQPVNFF